MLIANTFGYICEISNNMRKITLILIIHCSLLIINCFSQSITWQRTYNGPYNFTDYAWDIVASTNGNIFILGETTGYGGGYVIKINPYGDTIWAKLIDTINVHSCEAGISTADGGCIIASNGTTTKM